MSKSHRSVTWFLLPAGIALALLLGLFFVFSPFSVRAAGTAGSGFAPAKGSGSIESLAPVRFLLAVPGDVIVTEIMKDPTVVADSDGEWFELLNTTGADIDLNGWTLLDNDSDSHVIANGGPLTITAGSYLVLGANGDTGTNGGVTLAYSYGSGFDLANGADEIVLLDGSLVEIDRVEYDDGATYPDPTGAALALIYPTLDNNVGATWCVASTPYGGGDAGTPGASNDCGPPIVINEIHADPDPTAGDANGDGTVDGTQDEFVELVNVGGADLDLSGWILKDNTVSNRHIFPANTILPPSCAVVVFGGGVPTGLFGASLVQTASEGGLNWSNAGDIVFLNDPSLATVVSYTYGTEGGQNVALTRDPDITGPDPLVQHSAATGSGGALYSPGTKINSSFFVGCPQLVDLTVDKAGPPLGLIGENVVYTLTVSNRGILTATAVTLTDTLPISTTYVADSSGTTPSNPAPGVYAWALGDYGPDITSTVYLTVSLDSGLAFGTSLTNTTVVTTSASGDPPGDNSSLWVLTATSLENADLQAAKTGPVYGVSGENVVYTITLANNGTTTAVGVTLTDTLPISTTYVADNSGTTPANPSPGIYVWSLADLPAQVSRTINLTVTVDAALAGGTTITNAVEVRTVTAGDLTGDNADQWATTVYPFVTIQAIQTVADPFVDDASPLEGQAVWVEGVVTAGPDELDNIDLFVIEDPAGGPWSGLPVVRGGAFSTPLVEGDHVRLLGTVDEFFGLTELQIGSSPNGLEVISSGNPIPAPQVLATAGFDDADAAVSEQWEGVLIEFQNAAVTDEDLGFGEWQFDDGSGPARADDLGGEDGDLTYVPGLGDNYDFLRGVGFYSFGNYKLAPRYNADVGLQISAPGISKAAPILVAPGAFYTYTITIENELGFALSGVVITDVVPAGAAFAYALDGGVESGGVVSWAFPTLAYLDTLTARFAVTAPVTAGLLLNDLYAVSAANYVTPTFGSPVVTVVDNDLRIHHIQGAAHRSPLAGQNLPDIPGIVTAVASNGFYMQDPNPDSDVATSEGIFVYTAGSPSVAVGDGLSVTGDVEEYYPGGVSSGNLATTRLINPVIAVNSGGNPLPAAVVLGNGGRIPPAQVIDDDATGNVETSGSFDPATDGIDFYESVEGMVVQVNDAVVVGGNRFGEIAVVGDNGTNAGTFTPRGGLVLVPDDFNPERIIIDDALFSAEPDYTVGDGFTGPITGVVSYDFGNFKLLNPNPLPPLASGGLISETSPLTATTEQLLVASFNVLNLDPGDPPAKFAGLADQIVHHLNAPDIIALQEIQDNSGPANDGQVDADLTYSALAAAVLAAGGPSYEFREVPPLDLMDGGQPGANIRVGFLFRTDRGLAFIDRGAATAISSTAAVLGSGGVELTLSPGRIDPTNSAFVDSRKPLAGEFEFNGRRLFVVANHFNSKSGDDALFGRFQPPQFPSEIQRNQQAQVVNDFIDSILALDPEAGVIVLGDLNDFHFSTALDTLAGGVLTNLVDTLPANEAYTYIFDGNSQTLDHILLSAGLMSAAAPVYDIVHTNAEFDADVAASDHDPALARLTLPLIETPVAGFTSNSPVLVGELSVFTNTTTGTEPLGYQWLFGDGTLVVTDTHPVHAYSAAGDYTVVLSATNAAGSDVYTATYTLLPAGAEIYLPLVTKGLAPAGRLDLNGPTGRTQAKAAAKHPRVDQGAAGGPGRLVGWVRPPEGFLSAALE